MLFHDNPNFKGHERQCGKRTNFADLFRSSAPTMKSAMMEDTGIDFPMSVFENAVFALRIDGERNRAALEEAAERALPFERARAIQVYAEGVQALAR